MKSLGFFDRCTNMGGGRGGEDGEGSGVKMASAFLEIWNCISVRKQKRQNLCRIKV